MNAALTTRQYEALRSTLGLGTCEWYGIGPVVARELLALGLVEVYQPDLDAGRGRIGARATQAGWEAVVDYERAHR